jgi:aminoglycoside phosphotransferase (APT) family kinase protein
VPVPLLDLLRAHDVASGYLEKAIFATDDPAAIAEAVARAVHEHVHVPVGGALFYAASAGCVLGLQLADGRPIVLKVYQSHWDPSFLRAVQRVQRSVAATGFPCPTPVGEPVALGQGWATMESLLPDPGPGRPLDESFMAQSSAGLVRLLHSARGQTFDGLELHPFRLAAGDLYPIPHNPIFDLRGTATGAEWIDDWARRSWTRRNSDALRPVIAYLDWSARNVRLTRAGLVAVYDWDSLGVASEATAAGQAATTWRSTGETGTGAAPDAGEIERFIGGFARARGVPFSELEWGTARAAAVWVMAYSARCEHALEQATPWRRTRARDWLRTQAGLLLD